MLFRHADRPEVWTLVCAATLVVVALASTTVGATHVALRELPDALLDATHPAHRAVWGIRVPRIAGGALVGGALGVAGALMQAVVRNPLADPGLLGVTAGAGLGGLIAIVGWPELPHLVPLLAFVGGLVAVGVVVVALWSGARGTGPLRILLTGVAAQAVLFALIALVSFFFADRAPAFVAFTIGSLNGTGWADARRVLPIVALGTVLAIAARRELNLLLLDDDSAAGVGLAVRRARLGASCVAALLAAAAVSVAGLVGFVGLIVPNGMRLLAGPDHGALLPLCLLGGATLLVAADTAARTIAAPLELPVGALLALVGGPYFLVVLWRKLP
jgi:iron complex transport system permease protein